MYPFNDVRISFVHFIHNEPIRNSYVAQKMYFPDGDAMSDVPGGAEPRCQDAGGAGPVILYKYVRYLWAIMGD